MHEFRRFIQQELDARSWKQADLARRSGLTRSHISKLLRDSRDHLGQMPDAETIQGLATGFMLPEEVVRTAASRALRGYSDDGTALYVDLSGISTDALLGEVRRRITANFSGEGTASATVVAIEEQPGDEHADEEQESRTEKGGPKQRGTGRKTRSSGAPMKPAENVQAEDLTLDDQGGRPDDARKQADYALARRAGETEERRRRRIEGEPWDHADPEGPEDGA
ncbi:transcriptional regulator with XRE-family HTH domain [Rhodococcus percolatus]|uniref:helix-turn-helix domain-containing protein n=1 Tax=Rhodococcus opacus TaxID=37919 RepID=UPI0015FC28DD|nr:helix-turn-helix transcriptional regulator [Rhodococcus opacus]MBA8964651.1 transcriptional regulator with XRE-family HTH domain [Rhodococcus opacus]MBP2208203.1 transcriptional regulator with XRE-family HTH domain [Rhodococcus opacus]